MLARNWRSPGFRLLRIRRVDVPTGGPISIRSALIVQACDWVWGAAYGRLTRGPLRRWEERFRERGEASEEISPGSCLSATLAQRPLASSAGVVGPARPDRPRPRRGYSGRSRAITPVAHSDDHGFLPDAAIVVVYAAGVILWAAQPHWLTRQSLLSGFAVSPRDLGRPWSALGTLEVTRGSVAVRTDNRRDFGRNRRRRSRPRR